MAPTAHWCLNAFSTLAPQGNADIPCIDMHRPPPAQWRVERSVVQASAISLASVMNALVLLALHGHGQTSAWWTLAGISSLLSAMAFWGWLHGATGLLTWSGEQWCWLQESPRSQPQFCEICWVMDFQSFVLVRASNSHGLGSTRWLWLERGMASPNNWMALRRALIASFEAVPVISKLK